MGRSPAHVICSKYAVQVSDSTIVSGLSATAPLAFAAPAGKHIPIGVELYSVRDELAKDLMGTVRAVAKMGYEVVEFYAPYYTWTPEYAKSVRALLNDLGIRCHSTHNDAAVFTADG